MLWLHEEIIEEQVYTGYFDEAKLNLSTLRVTYNPIVDLF